MCDHVYTIYICVIRCLSFTLLRQIVVFVFIALSNNIWSTISVRYLFSGSTCYDGIVDSVLILFVWQLLRLCIFILRQYNYLSWISWLSFGNRRFFRLQRQVINTRGLMRLLRRWPLRQLFIIVLRSHPLYLLFLVLTFQLQTLFIEELLGCWVGLSLILRSLFRNWLRPWLLPLVFKS